MWTYKTGRKYSKVYLGLPVPDKLVVGCQWTITGSLSKRNYQAIEIHSYKTLLVELMSPGSYCSLIHADLLDLEDKTNADRAILLKLAQLLPKNEFCIWDPGYLWEPRSGTPSNLIIWRNPSSKQIEEQLMAMLEVWH